jgi:hypothetical protein
VYIVRTGVHLRNQTIDKRTSPTTHILPGRAKMIPGKLLPTETNVKRPRSQSVSHHGGSVVSALFVDVRKTQTYGTTISDSEKCRCIPPSSPKYRKLWGKVNALSRSTFTESDPIR